MDYDNDGALDLFANNNGTLKVLKNNISGNKWLKMRLYGCATNADAYGVKIVLKANGKKMVLTPAQGSQRMRSDLHVGLGSATLIDSLSIYWHKSNPLHLTNVNTNQYLNIYENQNGNCYINFSPTITVDAPATAKQNDTVQVAINTSALSTADGVIAYQGKLAYDATRLNYLSHTLVGTLNASGTAAVNSGTTGSVQFSGMNGTALNGTGSIIKFKFLAKTQLGKAPFQLSNFLYNTTSITSLTQDTVTIIDGIPPSGRITFSANPVRKADSLKITVTFNEKMALSPVPQLNLSGANILSNKNMTRLNDTVYVEKGNGAVTVKLATGTDLAANLVTPTPTSGTTFTVLPIVYGDIDTNKFVQAYDAALALQYSIGLNPLPTMDPLPWSAWRKAVANVDSVGDITANDASLILQYSANIITTFPSTFSTKRVKGNPLASVNITVEGNELVFRASGSLYALNLFYHGDPAVLGNPEVLDTKMMSVSNINATSYAIGLASAYATPENEVFMRIPLNKTINNSITFDLTINDVQKTQSVDMLVGLTSQAVGTAVVIYPNPTKDIISIVQGNGNTLKIMDISGREIHHQVLNSNKVDVSLKQLGAKGMYLIQVVNEKQEVLQTQKVILE